MESRQLSSDERTLLEFLLSKVNTSIIIPSLTKRMNDGNMGSITFDLEGTGQRKLDLIEAHYMDADDQLVVITLSLNEQNELFELDFWKTDFSELLEYPRPDQLKIVDNHLAS